MQQFIYAKGVFCQFFDRKIMGLVPTCLLEIQARFLFFSSYNVTLSTSLLTFHLISSVHTSLVMFHFLQSTAHLIHFIYHSPYLPYLVVFILHGHSTLLSVSLYSQSRLWKLTAYECLQINFKSQIDIHYLKLNSSGFATPCLFILNKKYNT